jgi:chemotaxis protein histidine kinase CheA
VLTLPVTLGVLRCLLARVGDERYAVPVTGVVESVSLRTGTLGSRGGDAEVHVLAGASLLVRHGVSVPLVDLSGALGLARGAADPPRAALVVKHGTTQVAWAVDRLEGEAELVVKDLGPFLGRVPGIAGATIDGSGSVVCLLDLRELGDRALGSSAPVASVVTATASAAPVGRRRGCSSSRTASACASSSGSSSRAPATWSRPPSTGWTAPRGCATSRPTSWCPTSRCPAWTATS